MKRPSPDDLHIAAMWLDVYEGAEDAEACHRVAKWLMAQSDAAEFREVCRKAGLPVKAVRNKMRQLDQTKVQS